MSFVMNVVLKTFAPELAPVLAELYNAMLPASPAQECDRWAATQAVLVYCPEWDLNPCLPVF